MQRRNVLLPDPDGPMMQATDPAGMFRSMPFRTYVESKDFRTSRANTIESAGTPNNV